MVRWREEAEKKGGRRGKETFSNKVWDTLWRRKGSQDRKDGIGVKGQAGKLLTLTE